MRWLVITEDYLPHWGGSRVYTHEMLSRVRQTESVVMTRSNPQAAEFDPTLPYDIERYRFGEWPRAGWLRQLPTYFAQIRHALRLARRYDIDMIHATEVVPSGFAAFVVARMLGIPYLIQSHDDPLGPPLRLQPTLRRFLCQRADRMVAACNFARRRLIDEGVEKERIWTIFPAIDRARFQPSSPATRAADAAVGDLGFGDRPFILTTGRLEPGKGHDRVLRAMPRLLDRIPELMYVIVGKGSSEPALREMSRELGLEQNVIFTGLVSEQALSACYRAARVFALLHHPVAGIDKEGFSIVALEASACGTPVIGSRHGGTADSIRDDVNGYRIDPDDEDEVAATLLRILEDRALRARLSGGALQVADSYDWQASAEQLEAHCLEFLGQG